MLLACRIRDFELCSSHFALLVELQQRCATFPLNTHTLLLKEVKGRRWAVCVCALSAVARPDYRCLSQQKEAVSSPTSNLAWFKATRLALLQEHQNCLNIYPVSFQSTFEHLSQATFLINIECFTLLAMHFLIHWSAVIPFWTVVPQTWLEGNTCVGYEQFIAKLSNWHQY